MAYVFCYYHCSGCLMDNGEKERVLHRSQQQRYYLMNHHESLTEDIPNRKRIGHQSIPREQRNRIRQGLASNSNRRATSTLKTGGSKRRSSSFKRRGNSNFPPTYRKRLLPDIPECNPDTGCVNITRTFATLGRTASMNCIAKNLVGQKTVS